jgi:hypothetical protein
VKHIQIDIPAGDITVGPGELLEFPISIPRAWGLRVRSARFVSNNEASQRFSLANKVGSPAVMVERFSVARSNGAVAYAPGAIENPDTTIVLGELSEVAGTTEVPLVAYFVAWEGTVTEDVRIDLVVEPTF